jgi:hypothetical protein
LSGGAEELTQTNVNSHNKLHVRLITILSFGEMTWKLWYNASGSVSQSGSIEAANMSCTCKKW